MHLCTLRIFPMQMRRLSVSLQHKRCQLTGMCVRRVVRLTSNLIFPNND